MQVLKWKIKRVALILLTDVLAYFWLRPRKFTYREEIRIAKTHPREIWEFIADFSNMIKLNPTINGGVAVIFNHYYITGYTPRKVSDCDVKCLRHVLSKYLKLGVKYYEDLTYSRMKRVLRELRNRDYSNDDCFMMFIMTHGKSNYLHAKNKRYRIVELWKTFLPKKCATLKGKPKLFFINACRGAKRDAGYTVKLRGNEMNTNFENIHPDFKIGEKRKSNLTTLAPNDPDFLILYSTFNGYVSFCDVNSGSWFIQAFCEVIEDPRNRKLEIRKLITTLIRYTAAACNINDSAKCQVPVMKSI